MISWDVRLTVKTTYEAITLSAFLLLLFELVKLNCGKTINEVFEEKAKRSLPCVRSLRA